MKQEHVKLQIAFNTGSSDVAMISLLKKII